MPDKDRSRKVKTSRKTGLTNYRIDHVDQANCLI